MNSTKRYLPLSLALVLVCSVHDARANSSLDPYAHVKAPQGVKKQSAAIPSVDAITTPSTYVTMPMGNQEEGNKQGLVGSMMSTITAPHKSIKKAGSSMVSGTKTAGGHIMKGSKMIGDGFAKSAGVIGQGIKSSGGALVGGTQAVGSKIANAVPGAGEKNTPQRRSISEMYENRAARELAKVDNKGAKQQVAELVKDSKDNKSITRRSFLSLKNKPKTSSEKLPESGFYDGAVANKAATEQQKAIKAIEKKPEQVAPKTLAAKPANVPSEKKWTNGFGLLKKPKLNKPTIGKGLFNRNKPAAVASPPTEVAKTNDLKPAAPEKVAAKAPVEPQAKPAQTASKTHVANLAPKTENAGRFSKFTKIPMPKLKLNPFAKNKAPQKDLQL